MATPTEQIQTSIPSYLKDPILRLVGQAERLSQLGYQPYARQRVDAQGRPVFDAQGKPVLEGIQRVEDFNPAQIAAFNRIAAMQEADQLRQATGFAGLAGLNAPQLGRYQAYGERVPMGGVDNWGAGEKYDKSKIPSNFDWQAYVSAPQNADLIKAGIDTPEEAERHYAKYGAGEGRALGTPGSTFQSSAFYNAPSFERMPTSFERVSADTLGQQQMAGIPGVMARGFEAGRMGPVREVTGERVTAPSMAGYERVGAPGEYGIERASGAGYGPLAMGPAERVGLGALQQYRMGAPERISGPSAPERVSALPIERFMMGPAERVGAERFGAGAMQEYMSPYMQGVVEAQKRAATREYMQGLPAIGAQAARMGGRGGTREALLQSEAQRGLAQRLSDIEATGLQQAYQQAASQFGQDRAAQMQAALANQAAGLTTGQQNLQAALTQQSLQAQQALEAQRLNQQAGLSTEQLRSEIAKANQAAGMSAEQANQQAALQVQQLGTQSGLQAALANQQAGLTVGQQNLAAEQARQQFMGQTGIQAVLANQQAAQRAAEFSRQQQMQAGMANQQAGLTVGQQNLAAQLQAMGMNAQQAMEAARLNQAADLTVGQQNLGAYQQAMLANQQADLQGQIANQQMGYNVGLQNLQARINQAQFGAGQGLQARQLNQAAQLQAQQQALAQLAQANQFNQQNAAMRAQYGLAGANLAEQSRQFGAGLGMQGLQQQLAAAGVLGNLGMQQYQQGMGITQAQLGAGGQQQALGQELLNQQYQDFLNAQRLPYQQAEFMSGILRGLPATGQTQTMYQAPGSMFGQIAGVGLGLGSLFGGLGSTTSSGGGGLFGGGR